MTTNKWILTGPSRRRTVAQFAGQAEPVWLGWSCSLSGPLGLSAYRHKNLANRTVIDLMVFLFKKKKNERKKTSNEKKKQEKFLIERHFDMHDIRTQTHTLTFTHAHTSFYDLERARIRLGLSLNLCLNPWVPSAPSALSFELQVKSNEKRTNGNSNKNGKWFSAFWASAWGLNLAVCRFRGVDGL